MIDMKPASELTVFKALTLWLLFLLLGIVFLGIGILCIKTYTLDSKVACGQVKEPEPIRIVVEAA